MRRIPTISHRLSFLDHLGGFKARWGIGRMRYTVTPGLYALGTPDSESMVMVTSNYKMSVDRLRSALSGMDCWILVLDTKGINVWCAAGKGTFGTEELVNRIRSTGLGRIVSHRRLILPQLSAPGVAAHEVKKNSGFSVCYGPIKAKDIIPFINSGFKATPEMRLKTFHLWERIVLIPVELVSALKWFLLIMAAFIAVEGFSGPEAFWTNALTNGLFAAFALMGALAAGTVMTPMLLPWIPGRPFSVKGALSGVFVFFLLLIYRGAYLISWPSRMEMAGWLFMISAVSAFLGMNFTGASTYTSLSGVKKEMKWAIPIEISATAIGLFLWFGSKWIR
ncbi:MAG: acetyl-CoA synthase subunit gamma [Deltaproteobacteria bacterium RBG_13_49_15]|nr:MAG: acetyl-CoA synthase subunit gamma [Deltaproteobacteria bacterium RBG_13_49_15]